MTSEGLNVKLPLIESEEPSQSILQSTARHSSLSGPSYSISGHSAKFKLPSTKVLKPGVEHQSGHLDSWPVHALNSGPSNISAENQSSFLQSTHHSFSKIIDKAPVIPKPKFLEQLESYLNKELRLLGCPPSGPHELRLQAHREVFEYLIEDFRTYKALLSSIKNEYELYIEYQDEVIKELKPLRSMMEIVKEDCERKLLAMKEDEKHEDAKIQQDNKRLMAIIEKMRNEELSYKFQIEKLQDEVAELYKQYRDECDARKVLLSEFNDLKFRQQEQKAIEDDKGSSETREDPVVLKLKLMRAREDLRSANQKINSMLADYGDVIPRREHELLETSYNNMEAEYETLKNDHAVLMMEHSTLQSLCNEIQSEKRLLNEELNSLKRSATPRPDWERCGEYLEGGVERWKELSEGRSSDRKVDILLAEIAGVDVTEVVKGDAFTGQGMDSSVPRYLRAEGSVKNKKITRKEVNSLINGFWHHRLSSTQQPPLPLDEEVYLYLLILSEDNDELAVESGYNLHEACSRFAHEPHVALFKKIIEGELEEEVFRHWLYLQTSLTEAFSQHQVGPGIINSGMVENILESAALPGKSPEHFKVLCDHILQFATDRGTVNFANLLASDEDGQPSQFSLLLLDHYQKESKHYVEEIGHEIANVETMSLGDMHALVQKLDGLKSYEEQLLLCARAFSTTVDEIISEDRTGLRDITIPTVQLLEQLSKIGIYRTVP